MFSNDGWYVSEPDSIEDFYLQMESETVVSGLLALDESDFESFWDSEFYSETVADTLEAFGFAFFFEDGRWQLAELNYLDEYVPHQNEVHLNEGAVEGRGAVGVLSEAHRTMEGGVE